MRGLIEVKISGKTWGFKFGTNSTALFCEKRGIELHEYNSQFISKESDIKKINKGDISPLREVHITSYRDLLWSAHAAYCRSRGIQEANEYEIGDLIDEMNQGDFNNVIETMVLSSSFKQEKNEEGSKKKRRGGKYIASPAENSG